MREVLINDELVSFEVSKLSDGRIELIYENERYEISRFSGENSNKLRVQINGKNIDIWKSGKIVDFNGTPITVESTQSAARSSSAHSDDSKMSAPMPGTILKVLVAIGDKVKKGQSLLVMEAMKMEHTIKAASDGSITAVHFKEGDLVDGGAELVDLEE